MTSVPSDRSVPRKREPRGQGARSPLDPRFREGDKCLRELSMLIRYHANPAI